MRLASEIVFILLALVWGSSFILMKIASASFAAAGVGLGRLIGGAPGGRGNEDNIRELVKPTLAAMSILVRP